MSLFESREQRVLIYQNYKKEAQQVNHTMTKLNISQASYNISNTQQDTQPKKLHMKEKSGQEMQLVKIGVT